MKRQHSSPEPTRAHDLLQTGTAGVIDLLGSEDEDAPAAEQRAVASCSMLEATDSDELRPPRRSSRQSKRIVMALEKELEV